MTESSPSPITPARSRFQHFSQERWWPWRGWAIRYFVAYPEAQAEATPRSPMLWLHGFGANAAQWRWNWSPFHRDRLLYAIDLLGFGASTKAATTYSIDTWVDQVYDFWREWIQVPIVLVGHSLGGLVALRLATRYPDMVERLVLLTLPIERAEIMPAWIDAIAQRIEASFATPWILQPVFRLVRRPQTLRRILRSVYRQSPDVDDEVIDLFSQPPTDWGAARAFCYLVQSRLTPQFAPQAGALLATLQTPTLVLWGDRDTVLPIAWGRRIVQSHPQVTWVELPEGGHCSYDEQPEQVNQQIMTWLGSGQ